MATPHPQLASKDQRAPSGSWTITISRRAALVTAVTAVALCVGLVSLIRQNGALERELHASLDRQAELEERERNLSATVARQFREIQSHEAEMASVQLQIESVEMQLDGVEHLGRMLRSEMGLADNPSAAVPRGGPYDGRTSLDDRAGWIRERLAHNLSELLGLHDLQRSREAARAAAQAASASGVGADRSASSEPADPPAAGTVGERSALADSEADPAPPSGLPTAGTARTTSSFGWRFFRGRPNFHTGVDFAMAHGSTVYATAAGTVVGAGWQPGYGHSVLIQHPGGYSTLYAHLSGPLVQVGDVVADRDPIGRSGSSGNSTGPHLHYEIWKDGRVLDPGETLAATGSADGSPPIAESEPAARAADRD